MRFSRERRRALPGLRKPRGSHEDRVEPGERLTVSDPIAAATTRADHGRHNERRGSTSPVHILVNSNLADISTNLVVNTDRRSITSVARSEETWCPSVSMDLSRGASTPAPGHCRRPAIPPRPNGTNAMACRANAHPWRRVSVFDDGRAYICRLFTGHRQGEMPALRDRRGMGAARSSTPACSAMC